MVEGTGGEANGFPSLPNTTPLGKFLGCAFDLAACVAELEIVSADNPSAMTWSCWSLS